MKHREKSSYTCGISATTGLMRVHYTKYILISAYIKSYPYSLKIQTESALLSEVTGGFPHRFPINSQSERNIVSSDKVV